MMEPATESHVGTGENPVMVAPSPPPPPVPTTVVTPAPTPGAYQPLGQILLSRTQLSAEKLDEALAEQRRDRRKDAGRIGEILIRQHLVTEEEVLAALALQLGLASTTELRPEDVDNELIARVPINFAKTHRILPVRRLTSPGGADTTPLVQVALADPLDVLALDEVRRVLGAEIEPLLVVQQKIVEAINKVYARGAGDAELGEKDDDELGGEAEELVDILDLTDEAPIIRWVNSLMFQAVKERASDIHIEPREKELLVRYRIDGVLYEHKRANKSYINSILSRVKIMAGLNIAEKRLPQDGRIRRKIAGKDIDMRVATAPTPYGERITIRLLDRSSVLLDLADIGFGEDHLTVIHELIRRPHGILLVTGPTGSGKTTTLYSCLSQINTPDLNILTVEDPVEYQLDGISQVQVNPKIDLTFANAIRSFLRHDPDVIMVGEVRDSETASMAITASLTGHLVFSTIHTNDSAGAITRLVDMGIEPFLVASSLIGLLAQRLVRRVCPDCRELHRPTPEELGKVNLDSDAFFAGRIPLPRVKTSIKPPPPGMLYRARESGCQRCSKTGYTGRTGIYELLLIDDDIRGMALKNVDSTQLKRLAIQKGMRTLRDDGALKVRAGMTTIEEVLLVTAEDYG